MKTRVVECNEKIINVALISFELANSKNQVVKHGQDKLLTHFFYMSTNDKNSVPNYTTEANSLV